MTNEAPITLIEPDKWYKPSEISEMGLILNTQGEKSKQYVLRLIRKGLLSWKNYATGETQRAFYKVSGKEIIRFREERDKEHRY